MNYVKKQPQGDELDGYFSQQANISTINRLTESNASLKEALKELGDELTRVLEEKNKWYDQCVVTNDALGRLLRKMVKNAATGL